MTAIKKEKSDAQDATRVAEYRADEAEDRQLCIVCTTEERQIVIAPCQHCVLCERCAEQVQTCPICRADIQSRQRLTLS